MSKEWKEVVLSDVATIDTGFPFKSKFYEEQGNLRVIRGKNVTEGNCRWGTDAKFWNHSLDKLGKYKVQLSDIVIGMDGSKIGKNRALVKSGDLPAILAQRVCRVRANSKSEQKYLWQIINSNGFENYIDLIKTGTSIPHISLGQVGKFSFKIPPLPEQKAIAHILGTLDDKIELNRKTNATLEAMAQALFKSWFVDFDPVLDNALAAGNIIPEALQAKAAKRKAVLDRHSARDAESASIENGTPLLYTNPKLAALFPSTFVFNEILEKWIPEGWEVKKIKDVGNVITGKTPSSKTPEHFGDVYPFVTPTDFKNYFKIVIDSQRKLSSLGFENNRKRVLPKDSVLVTCIGSDMGKVVMNKVECMTNQQINSVVPKDDGVSGQYLYHFFNWNYELLRTLAFGGSTMPILNKSEFEGIDILVPDRLVASEVSRNFRESDEKVLFNLKQTEVLTKLRDNLLPQLISGKVRVPGEAIVKVEMLEDMKDSMDFL
ncbi:restriction endonuclease subunit S [Formosa sp. A9]|uniref:restriction endonuclease subunit S n=1 Tax=Formosa sp. A9 TaxID=3442641 RepID=UPI003EBF6DE1